MRCFVGFVSLLALGVIPLTGCGESGRSPECEIDEDCDDQNQCTEDRCNAGRCENRAVVCDDSNECTNDVCDTTTGACEFNPVDDGAACDDGNECTVEMCASGACESTPVTDGTACAGDVGICQEGSCRMTCTEQGIRAAVAAGGGPHLFDCDGPTTVSTSGTIFTAGVILDGEDNLIVDGKGQHRVFNNSGRTTLRRMTITGGLVETGNGGGISNGGTLTLDHVTVSDNTATYRGSSLFRGTGGGIYNTGTLTLIDSTVSGNTASWEGDGDHCGLLWYVPCGGHGGGIENEAGSVTLTRTTIDGNVATERGGGIENSDGGTLALTNSTVSGNNGGGIYDFSSTSVVTLIHVTLSQNTPYAIAGWGSEGTRTVMNSLVLGDQCSSVLSEGHNIEAPGNTCGFDDPTDQFNVSADDLKLGPLEDNGGPTRTHALGAGSVAIDWIPEADCLAQLVTTDQRGEPRPETGGTMCDVGAFEVQP